MKSTDEPKARPGNHTLKIALGMGLSLIFMALALYHIDFHKLIGTFRALRPGWLAAASALILCSYFFRSLLWRQLLLSHRQTRLWNLFRIITLGYFVNNLFPLKVGEVLRAWLLGKQERLSTSLALATVVMERGMDLIALLVFFSLMLSWIPFAGWLKLSGTILTGFGAVFLVFVLLNYKYGRVWLVSLERPLERLLPGHWGGWLHKQLGRFLEGLTLIKTFPQFLLCLLWVLLTWLSWIGVAFACFQAMGLSLPFGSAIFLMVVLNFGLMIPSSPGGLGIFEYMIILALTPFGVEKETALGVGFAFHMLHYFLTLVLGWIFFVQFNLTMKDMMRDSQSAPLAEGEAAAEPKA